MKEQTTDSLSRFSQYKTHPLPWTGFLLSVVKNIFWICPKNNLDYSNQCLSLWLKQKLPIMSKKIYDLRISYADDPESNIQIAGSRDTILPHISGTGLISVVDAYETQEVEVLSISLYIDLKHFSITNCN